MATPVMVARIMPSDSECLRLGFVSKIVILSSCCVLCPKCRNRRALAVDTMPRHRIYLAQVRFPDVMAAIDAKLFGRWCAAARLEVKLFYFIGLFITTND